MKKILVADDSVTIQKVIALTFADEPYEVKSVGTGTEALELVRAWEPDILLADVIMPQMNGYELCRAVKENAETSSIPVLLLAGTFEAFDEEEAGAVRADDYITKPFESGELIGKVRSLTEEEARPEPAPEAPIPETQAPEVEAPHAGEEPPAESTVPEQVSQEDAPSPPPAVQEPPGPRREESAEPDIWDILSEVEDLYPSAPAEAGSGGVSSLNPLEEKGVIDVGSFDVGLDRPEPEPPPFEPPPEPPKPFPRAPAPEGDQPFEPTPLSGSEEWTAPPAAVHPPGEAAGAQSLKSRVEDREKDFFGFEIEGSETSAAPDSLGDAVEEITFDLEEPPPEADEPRVAEVSFMESEPLSPEPTAGPEPEYAPEPMFEPSMEVREIPTDDEAGQGGQPDLEELAPLSPPEEWQEPETDSGVPELSPALSAVPETGPESPEESEPPLELDMKTAFLQAGAVPSALDEAEIRRIIEEKVEKVVWEVVPELAEVLIREAIDKIKGGS